MRILITGSSGFLGSHLMDAAKTAGHHPVPFDLPQSILNKNDLLAGIHGADLVIHCAAQADVYKAQENPASNFETNVFGTENVAAICEEANVPLFFISTLCVYGNNQPADEGTLPAPTENYACSKMAAEYIVKSHSMPWAVFRCPTMYGPRMRSSLFIARAFEACMNDLPITVNGDGSASRQYGYAPDVAKAIIGTANIWEHINGRIINLPGPQQISIMDVVETAGRIVGIPPRIVSAPARPWEINRQEILAPGLILMRTLFEDGMRQTYEWMRQRMAA